LYMVLVIFVCTLSAGDALIPPCQPGHLMWVSFTIYYVVNMFNLVITALCNELHVELLVSAKINSSDWFTQCLPQELLVYAISSLVSHHPLSTHGANYPIYVKHVLLSSLNSCHRFERFCHKFNEFSRFYVHFAQNCDKYLGPKGVVC
jgi:hypothetical protein